jgi:PKD domain/IPT/TIG domain
VKTVAEGTPAPKLAFVLLAAAALWALRAVPAGAVVCTIDAVPAATLLVPYFEVDLGNTTGSETLFSINNASANAVLVHVVLWSDLSVPVLDFNLYLTGYDVQTIDLRDILVAGNLPRTASAGQDPGDTISPQGRLSQDVDFASCNGVLPPPPLPAFFTAHLQAALTGRPSAILAGNCAGQDLGDDVARGYITADTVSGCSLRFPGDAGYFAAGGTGDATDQNVLWGDYLLIRPPSNFLAGGTLVHVEADPANPATSTAGRYTFYGRYDNWTAIDNREPLATNFGSRFMAGADDGGNSSLVVWRDSKVNQGPFPCPAIPGLRPSWYWLGQEAIVIFDEQEHPMVPQSFPFSPQPPAAILVPFPAETQLVRVGGSGKLPVPYAFGWLLLDLNAVVAAAGNNPPVDPRAAQAFVTSFEEIHGHFAVGIDAVRFDSACAANHPLTCFGSAKPVPVSVMPGDGGPSGGELVVIQGTSFDPSEVQVQFGTALANLSTFQSTPTELAVVVPPFTGTFPTEPCVVAGNTGTREVPVSVDVTVTDTLTECSGSLAGGFTYLPSDASCHVMPPPPVASFIAITAPASDTVIFADTSAGNPVSWSWQFGDGGTSSQQNPAHTYALPGTYLVTLSVFNAGGSSQASQLVTVPGL